MAVGSACECNSLALKLTKENTKNVKFEDPSLMFSIVWDARDQTGPGSLSLRRETLPVKLCVYQRIIRGRRHILIGSPLNVQWTFRGGGGGGGGVRTAKKVDVSAGILGIWG